MFLNRNARNGSHFLILMTTPDPGKGVLGCMPMRGLVRRTAFHQLGNFMMGHVTITGKTDGVPWKHRVSLSGTYGGDGLTCDVPREVYDKGTDVPPELVAAWNTGDGWNSAGSEGPAMRAWGLLLMRKEAEAKACKPRPEPTGKMSADASYKYWKTLRERATRYMRDCVREEWTTDEMREQWNARFSDDGVSKRAQAWVAQNLSAWRECFREILHQQFLEWYTWTKGVGHVTIEQRKAGEREGKWTWQDTVPERGAWCWKSTGKIHNGYDPAIIIDDKGTCSEHGAPPKEANA